MLTKIQIYWIYWEMKHHSIKQKQKTRGMNYTAVFKFWNFEAKANGHTFVNQIH